MWRCYVSFSSRRPSKHVSSLSRCHPAQQWPCWPRWAPQPSGSLAMNYQACDLTVDVHPDFAKHVGWPLANRRYWLPSWNSLRMIWMSIFDRFMASQTVAMMAVLSPLGSRKIQEMCHGQNTHGLWSSSGGTGWPSRTTALDLEFSCDHGIWKGPPHVTMVYHHLPCGAWKKPCTNCWYMVYPTEIPSCTLLHIYQ